MTQTLNQAFIFAAGRGERMRPLTDTIPKPLLPLKGKSIIDYAIEKLLAITSIKRVVVNGFYLASQIEDHLKKFNDSRLFFSQENAKIETGGALLLAMKSGLIEKSEPLLTINGDVVWQDEAGKSDIEALFQKFLELRSRSKEIAVEDGDRDQFFGKNHQGQNELQNLPKILLGLKKTKDYFGYETSEDKGGDFNLIGESLQKKAQRMHYAYIGLQMLDLSILKDAPTIDNSKEIPNFSVNYFYQKALNLDTNMLEGVAGYELSGRYFHLGEPQTLAQAQDFF